MSRLNLLAIDVNMLGLSTMLSTTTALGPGRATGSLALLLVLGKSQSQCWQHEMVWRLLLRRRRRQTKQRSRSRPIDYQRWTIITVMIFLVICCCSPTRFVILSQYLNTVLMDIFMYWPRGRRAMRISQSPVTTHPRQPTGLKRRTGSFFT